MKPYQFKAQCLVCNYTGVVLHNSKEEYQEVTVCPKCKGAFVDIWRLGKYQKTETTEKKTNKLTVKVYIDLDSNLLAEKVEKLIRQEISNAIKIV